MTSAQTEQTESHEIVGMNSPATRTRERRSRHVIDWRSQLRDSTLPVMGTVVLLCLLNVAIYFVASAGSKAVTQVDPVFEPRLHTENLISQGTMLLGSLVFVVVVAFVAVQSTHRTAGPAYRIKKHLQRLAEGDLTTRIRLRQRDNLQDLAAAFNQTVQVLQERAAVERAKLHDLARAVEQLDSESKARKLAVELRRLADEKCTSVQDQAVDLPDPMDPAPDTTTVSTSSGQLV